MKPNQKGNPRINNHIKRSLYNWIINHQKVLQSPILNDSLKVNIDGHNRPQIYPKLLLQVSIRERHNSIVSEPVDGGIKEARDVENNIIISDSTLHSLLPTQH